MNWKIQQFSNGGRVFALAWAVLFAPATLDLRAAAAPAIAVPQPRRGGTLRFATVADLRSLDPATIFMGDEGTLTHFLFNGLLDLDADGNVVPMLAEQLPDISPDALTYTFRLRSGVFFSNGRELTAEDVVFTLERFLDPKTASPETGYFRNIRGGDAFEMARQKEAFTNSPPGITGRWIEPKTVAGLRALDRRTVQIQLDQPNVALMQILAAVFSGIVPREEVEHRGERFVTHPIGTGPFVLKEWIPGVSLHFERNTHYFRPGQPLLDAIDVTINIDLTTQAMMLERGEIDVQSAITDPDFLRFRKDRSRQPYLEVILGTSPIYVSLNCELPPFTNRLVRIAMNHAVDKEAIVRKMLHRAVPLRGALPMNVHGFNPNLPGYDYNPVKAKALLAKAGFSNGFETTLWVGTGPMWTTLGLCIQDNLKAVGVTVNLKVASAMAGFEAIQRRKTVPMGLQDCGATIDDPKDTLDSLLNGENITEQACMNTAFYSNERVQQLFRAASVASDAQHRIQLYQKIEELIVEDAPWLFLCQRNTEMIRNPWLKGFRPYGFWPALRLETTWIER